MLFSIFFCYELMITFQGADYKFQSKRYSFAVTLIKMANRRFLLKLKLILNASKLASPLPHQKKQFALVKA